MTQRSPDAETSAGPGLHDSNTAMLGGPGAALVAAVLGIALVRAWVAGHAALTDDEAYYRLWALAPAMSYLDHPPMIGWMIAAGRAVAGDNPLGIRLCAVLISVLGPLLLWRTAAILFGSSVARRALWIALAMPLMAVGGVIITPDTPSVLFWGLAAWAIAELHVSRNGNWWLAVGLFAGLGLLSKYSNLFVGAGIVLWLLLIPANRPWFRAWQLWAGGALACLLALPIMLWNAQYDWISFAKQFGRVGRGSQFTAAYLAELVGGLVGLMSPIIALFALWGLVRVVRSAVTTKDQASALVAAGALPFLAYLLLHSLHDRVQPNWMAPLYPAFAVCAAIALAQVETPRAPAVFGTLGKWSVAVGFLLSGLVYAHALHPLLQMSPSRDPSSQMRGWPEFASHVERLRVASGACWVATASYATTGQLAYALKDKAPVVQLTERLRYLHLPPVEDAVLGCPALYVELERRGSAASLGERFGTVTPLGNSVRAYRGTAMATYALYLLAEPRSKDWLRPSVPLRPRS